MFSAVQKDVRNPADILAKKTKPYGAIGIRNDEVAEAYESGN